jgi:acylpyruvate hydrolase
LVFGYAIGGNGYRSGLIVGIDLTARKLQENAKRNGLPWDAAKGCRVIRSLILGMDEFAPLSMMIPDSQNVNPHNVRLQLSVNGEIRQDDTTQKMITKIPGLIRSIAKYVTIERGDVILSTP